MLPEINIRIYLKNIKLRVVLLREKGGLDQIISFATVHTQKVIHSLFTQPFSSIKSSSSDG